MKYTLAMMHNAKVHQKSKHLQTMKIVSIDDNKDIESLPRIIEKN